VAVHGAVVWTGMVPRTAAAVLADLAARADPRLAGCAVLVVPGG
jgi:hypothetical protein